MARPLIQPHVRRADIVHHWFAGYGFVQKPGSQLTRVDWADGRSGYARTKDLCLHSRNGSLVGSPEPQGDDRGSA